MQHYAELTVEGTALVLCHYPFRTWNKMGRGVVNLHGHSHGRLKPMPRQHDVGVDAWDVQAGAVGDDPRRPPAAQSGVNGTHRHRRPFLRAPPSPSPKANGFFRPSLRRADAL